MNRTLLWTLAALVLISCEKEEIPVAPFDRGGTNIAEVYMGAGYVNQVYFGLEANEIAAIHHTGDWDLAFKNSSDAEMIVLNDSRFMSAWKSNHHDIRTASDTTGFGIEKRTEVMATAFTDPAMGSLDGVYLIDLGFSAIGLPLGLQWVEVAEVTESTYLIRHRQ